MGATGWLSCLDLVTGAKIWSVDAAGEAKTKCPEWGFSGSPLVFDGKVIAAIGGDHGPSLSAYDAATGHRIWTGGESSVSYGSPSLVELAGVPQILILDNHSLASHDPRTGAVLWEQRWGVGYPLVAMPIVAGPNRVMFTAGYGVGAELFEIQHSGGKLKQVSIWRSNRMKAKFSNPVLKDNYVYGLDDGILACIDIRDGALKWKGERYGHGQALLVGDRLLLMSEDGQLVLLRPTPESPNELTRFPVFHGKTWNPIALAGNRLLARTDREAACLLLPVESTVQ
jgi:outer membrane protein assembly factor BamB